MAKNTGQIIIGSGILDHISRLFSLVKFSKIGILTDTHIKPHWLSVVKKGVRKDSLSLIISPGEKAKTIETAKKIWGEMFKHGFDRHSILINLGGGVIGDLGGFAASTFMWGIPFLQIPTTVLSQVDASVGGKVGVNFAGIKNGLGGFNQPMGVVIDIKTLTTLPSREFISGFAEIIKHGVIADRGYFNLIGLKKPEEFNETELIKIIKRSVEIKLKIVQKDPEEAGLRKVLNFGHTIGHAIESLSLSTNNPLLHGEAIAIGMLAESKLASLLGMLPEKDSETIEKSLRNAGLPIRTDLPTDAIRKLIVHDKKNNAQKILWSLPKKIGQAVFNIEAAEKLIVKAIQYIQI